MTLTSGVEVLHCPVLERESALKLLYRHHADSIRPKVVAEALEDADRGELDLDGLWIARRRGRVVGALLTQALAGRAAAVWPPEVDGLLGGGRALAARLVQSAIEDYRAREFRLAQALVDPTAPRRARLDLTRGGLPLVTELIYMTRPTADPLPIDPSLPRFQWVGFSPSTEADFREILNISFIGSLDMPELEGHRALEDLLATHRAGGRFDPRRWRLGRLADDPAAAAIVLLSVGLDPTAWEVTYLGLTPKARGRGLGRVALGHALDLARAEADQLELAVDVRNHPASRLYRRCGFQPFDRRWVHLVALGQG